MSKKNSSNVNSTNNNTPAAQKTNKNKRIINLKKNSLGNSKMLNAEENRNTIEAKPSSILMRPPVNKNKSETKKKKPKSNKTKYLK